MTVNDGKDRQLIGEYLVNNAIGVNENLSDFFCFQFRNYSANLWRIKKSRCPFYDISYGILGIKL